MEDQIDKEFLTQKAELLNTEGKPSATIDPARLRASLENAQATGVFPAQPDIKKERQIAVFKKILEEKAKYDQGTPFKPAPVNPFAAAPIAANPTPVGSPEASPQPIPEKKGFFAKIAGWFKKGV